MLLYFIIVIYLEICRTVKQFIIIIIITSTSDLQPSTAISNPSPGKSVLNKFKPY